MIDNLMTEMHNRNFLIASSTILLPLALCAYVATYQQIPNGFEPE